MNETATGLNGMATPMETTQQPDETSRLRTDLSRWAGAEHIDAVAAELNGRTGTGSVGIR